MKQLLIALLLLGSHLSFSQELLDDNVLKINESRPMIVIIDYVRVDSVKNEALDENAAIYHFEFQNLLPSDSNLIVHYSVDSTEFWRPMKAGRLSITTTPGYHSFQIYINSNYEESFSPMLGIAGQTELTYHVNLNRRRIEMPVRTYKPVIYLYPDATTDVSVSVDIHNGKSPFFYPNYTKEWLVNANPDGNLSMNGETYRYLFWEAEQPDHLNEINVDKGFVVQGGNAVAFLDEKLTAFGLNSKEKADFITFWGPLMAKNEKSLVRFEWNEACDKFANLQIKPKPDCVYRIYIFVAPLEADVDIAPQEIPSINREGFTVIEWGGQVSNYQPNTSL